MRILEAVNPRRPLIQSIDTACALRAAKALRCLRRLQLRLRLPIYPIFDYSLFVIVLYCREVCVRSARLATHVHYSMLCCCIVVRKWISGGGRSRERSAVHSSRVESSRLAGLISRQERCNSDHMCCVETRMKWVRRAPRAASEVLFGDADKWSNSLSALSLTLFLGTAGAALWDSGKRDVRRLEIAPSERRLQSDDELPCALLASALIA